MCAVPEPSLTIGKQDIGPAILVSVSGTVLLRDSGRKFSAFMQGILDTQKKPVIVDLSSIHELDSTGLGELAGYLQLFARAGRRMVVARPSKKIRRLLDFMNMERVLPVFESIDDAKAAVSAA